MMKTLFSSILVSALLAGPCSPPQSGREVEGYLRSKEQERKECDHHHGIRPQERRCYSHGFGYYRQRTP